MEPPSNGSSPQMGRPGGSARTPAGTSGGTKNAFSKFFTQIKNLIAEAATIEPVSDVAPGVDHCCKTSRCHYGLPIHHLDAETLAAFGGSNHCSLSTTSSSNGYALLYYTICMLYGLKFEDI